MNEGILQEINETRLEENSSDAIIRVRRQLIMSIILQVFISLMIITAILLSLKGNVTYRIVMIASLFTMFILIAYGVTNALAMQAILSGAGTSLVTIVIAPYIVHLVISIRLYKKIMINSKNVSHYYVDNISISSLSIEQKRIEIEEKFKNREITKKKFKELDNSLKKRADSLKEDG